MLVSVDRFATGVVGYDHGLGNHVCGLAESSVHCERVFFTRTIAITGRRNSETDWPGGPSPADRTQMSDCGRPAIVVHNSPPEHRGSLEQR
jgi:hypothetical protein